MMKRFTILATMLLTLCLLTGVTFAGGRDDVDKERAEIEQLSQNALKNLYTQKPHARKLIDECYAYATLSNSSVKVLLFGSAHGRGLAVNHETGEKYYMRMKQVGAGLGIGAKEYELIFLITNEKAWKSFIAGETRFVGSASATAKDGGSGVSYDGATYVAEGVWMYQNTSKGLALEAFINGTKIYADKKLNRK